MDDLIVRFLDGYASQAEIQRLEEWKAASSENFLEFKEMEKIWTVVESPISLDKLEIQEDWMKVQAKINTNKPNLKPSHQETPVRRLPTWISRAASIAALFVIGFGGWFFLNNGSGNINVKQEIALEDGTKVWLNKGAKLDYSNGFNKEERRVTLTGEGFFEVMHNPAKPFIVQVGNSEVKVLGTSFNIKETNNQVEVAVRTGKVKFSGLDNNSTSVTLLPGESAYYDQKEVVKNETANPNYLAWKTGEFVFEDIALNEVVKDLSNFYGQSIQLKNDHDCHVTATFKSADLDHIAKVIQRICSVKVKTKNDKLILY